MEVIEQKSALILNSICFRRVADLVKEVYCIGGELFRKRQDSCKLISNMLCFRNLATNLFDKLCSYPVTVWEL